ncbi:hypothetical protein J6590_032989 [Homalodisca vitripennis]|nr:hypothetical protein J6590_032989 [Homalodisca vitripennis]
MKPWHGQCGIGDTQQRGTTCNTKLPLEAASTGEWVLTEHFSIRCWVCAQLLLPTWYPLFVWNTVKMHSLGLPKLGDLIKKQTWHLFDSTDSSDWHYNRARSSREGPPPLQNLRRPRSLTDDPS